MKDTRCETDKQIDGVIGKYLAIKGWNKSRLAQETGLSKSTLSTILKYKEYLRIYQLRLIYDSLGVPSEERQGL